MTSSRQISAAVLLIAAAFLLPHGRSARLLFCICIVYYAPPIIGGTLSDDFVWRLSDVCLSRISGLTREQRGLGRPKLAER